MRNIEKGILTGLIIASVAVPKIHAQTNNKVNNIIENIDDEIKAEYIQKECDSLESDILNRKKALWERYKKINENPFPYINKEEVTSKDLKRLRGIFTAYINIGILVINRENRDEYTLKGVFLYLSTIEKTITNTELLFDAFESSYMKMD